MPDKPKSLLFKFDMLPPNAGDYKRMHWAVAKEVRDAWEYHVAQMVRDMGYFPNEDNVLVHKATVVWRLFVKRRRDKDNAHQMLKIPLDAMRRQHILYNDSPVWIDIKLEQTNSQKEWCEIEIIPEEGGTDGSESGKRKPQHTKPSPKQHAPTHPADNPTLPVWT